MTTGSGTSVFTYGDGHGFGTGPNKLTFAAVSGGFSSVTESPFKVGTITYFNGTTAVGTTPDSVQLELTLDFSAPALGKVTSDYGFDLVSTLNTNHPDASADYVYLPSAFSTTTFLIGSTTYNVKLTGFSNVVGDGFLASNAQSFHVREDETASADLYAVVTTQVAAVPEPETYALMLAGLGVVGFMARRRKQQA